MSSPGLAIFYPGDREVRDRSDTTSSRFAAVFEAFRWAVVAVEPSVYQDDLAEEVRHQLLAVDGVLVWHNPIEGGRTRAYLVQGRVAGFGHQGVNALYPATASGGARW